MIGWCVSIVCWVWDDNWAFPQIVSVLKPPVHPHHSGHRAASSSARFIARTASRWAAFALASLTNSGSPHSPPRPSFLIPTWAKDSWSDQIEFGNKISISVIHPIQAFAIFYAALSYYTLLSASYVLNGATQANYNGNPAQVELDKHQMSFS